MHQLDIHFLTRKNTKVENQSSISTTYYRVYVYTNTKRIIIKST